jgi:DNA-binding response OmpR family regulator
MSVYKKVERVYMAKERILIVDDEEKIRDIIEEYISIEGYFIDKVSNGKIALEYFDNNTYSVIVLDVMMPYLDGWSVCREIRKKSKVPIIMLTARGEEYDKLLAFELGVDDYMVKPFSPKELLARIKAIIRRTNPQIDDASIIQFEGLKIDVASRNVYIHDKKIILAPKEYDVLYFFAKNPNRVFSRNDLLDKVWGYDFMGDDRTVDTHIKMVRDRLGEYRNFIVTVWGVGYKFELGDNK